MAKSRSLPVNLPSARPLMNPLVHAHLQFPYNMNQLGVLLLHAGWDATASQG